MNVDIERLKEDYIRLENEAKNTRIADIYFLEEMGKLDQRYKQLPFHYEYSDGLLSNIGSIRNSEIILKCALKRLRKKKVKQNMDKYFYDIGNTILSIAGIKKADSNKEYVIDEKRCHEALKYLSLVTKNDKDHYIRSLTNIANILDQLGRNFESIYKYNAVLNIDPKFGMALGNKAKAIEYYTRLCPQRSLVLMNEVVSLLEKALQDERLEQIGGSHVRGYFNDLYKYYKEKLEDNDEMFEFSNEPEGLDMYQRFCLDKNFYLNYDFGYYYDGSSLEDNYFPKLTEKLHDKKKEEISFMSEKTFYSFEMFNQILEDYTTARYQYFIAFVGKDTYIEKSLTTKYIYLFDYSRHSIFYGVLKSVFASLFRCLDKLSCFIKFYFIDDEIDLEEDYYFSSICSDKFKELVDRTGNIQLLALYSLSKDFNTGYRYERLRHIRNRITHSYFKVVPYTENMKSSEITEKQLLIDVDNLFLIVKAAMFYTITAVNLYREEGGLYGQMIATHEDEIFGIYPAIGADVAIVMVCATDSRSRVVVK